MKKEVTSNCKRLIINKVVNISKYNEVTVLQEIFQCNDGMRGATGSTFYPVSKQQLKKLTTLNAIKELLMDSVSEKDIPFEYLEYETGRHEDPYKRYKDPYKRWAKAIKDAGEAEQFAFDTSYTLELEEELRKYFPDENKYPIFECLGGGRMFDANFKGNTNEHLSKYIRFIEK